MKTNMKIAELIALSLTLSMVPNLAHAQGNTTHGGGKVVPDAGGKNELYDLTELTCDVKKGSELLDTMIVLKERIEAIKKVYWYFGFSLEREIKNMTFCFTDKRFNPNALPRSTDPKGILLITGPTGTDFVGIRLFQSKEAYIRNPLYGPSSELSKAMTIIHETMHSFIPLDVADRDMKLRNLVHKLSVLDPTQASAATNFETEMSFDRVNFPLHSRIKKSMKYIEFALGSIGEQRAALLNGTIQMQTLLKSPWKREVSELMGDDKEYLNSIAGNEAREFLSRYCEDQDEEVLRVLRVQSNDTFDIDLFSLSLQSTQDEIKDAPSPSTLIAVAKKFTQIYSKISQSTATLNRERIQVTGGVRFFAQNSGSTDNPNFALGLIPIESFAENAPLASDTREWVGLVTRLARSLSVQDWKTILSQNGTLERLLKPEGLIAKITALQAPMSDEKRAVLNLIPRLYSNFKDAVYQELKNQHLTAHADAWKQLTE